MSRRKQLADNRADTRGGGWAGIPHVVIDSPAYRHLSLWARAVLIEIVREFNGYNNGTIALSFDQFCQRLGNSNRRALSRSIAELVEHGLIAVEAEGEWKPRLAREYRLTWVTVGNRNSLRAASNEYRDWRPAQKSSGDDVSPEKRLAGNASSPERRKPGYASSPAKITNPRKSAISEGRPMSGSGDDVSLLISKPYPCPERGGPNGRETPSFDPQKAGGHFSASTRAASA